MLMACEDCAEEAPCIEWARQGTAYSARILSHFTSANPGELRPYSRYGYPEASCGEVFDFDDTSSVTLTAKSRRSSKHDCEGCYEFAAMVDAIPGATIVSAAEDPQAIAEAYFSDTVRVSQRNGCTGIVTVGLVQVADLFVEKVMPNPASRAMLVRTFAPDNDNCEVDIAESNRRCWDSWFVEVKDSRGTIVSN